MCYIPWAGVAPEPGRSQRVSSSEECRRDGRPDRWGSSKRLQGWALEVSLTQVGVKVGATAITCSPTPTPTQIQDKGFSPCGRAVSVPATLKAGADSSQVLDCGSHFETQAI